MFMSLKEWWIYYITYVPILSGSLLQSTPIVVLKEYIEKVTGVPTHQQRLTIGSIVLEDWDHDSNMMFIGHYPAIQHGSLLHIIVQTEGGFQVKVQHYYYNNNYYNFKVTLKGTRGSQVYIFETYHSQFYMNISHNEVTNM